MADEGQEGRYSEEEVSEILPGQHQVITNVSEYTYSKLIVATGSKPVIPRIKNLMDCDDWSNCRTIEDLDKIVKDGVLNEKKNIVILGAGLIGVEAVENLKKIGKNVTLVELSPQVLPQWDSKFGYFAESVLIFDLLDVRF